MTKTMKPVQKVCFVYLLNDKVQRTRFFKSTSSSILYTVERRLKARRGVTDLKKVTRREYEAQYEVLNSPEKAPSAHVDLRFISKTHAQREWCEKLYRRIGRPLAF